MDMMALRRAVMYGPHLENAMSGNNPDVAAIAHFVTSAPAKVKNLMVYLPYKADGYTSVKVTHAGVNILQCYALTSGTSHNVAFSPYRNANGEVERVHISGTANGNNTFRNFTYNLSQPYAWPPDGAYATYAYSASATILFVGNIYSPFDRDGERWGTYPTQWKIYDLVHSTTNKQEWVRTQLYPYSSSGVAYNDDLYPLICLASNQGCAFEPYKGHTYTASFSKIYGGTVDLVSGKVVGAYAADGSDAVSEQTITTQVIDTLSGINNVWADAGTVSIKYWAN